MDRKNGEGVLMLWCGDVKTAIRKVLDDGLGRKQFYSFRLSTFCHALIMYYGLHIVCLSVRNHEKCSGLATSAAWSTIL
jgi:hypothetical protein